MTKNQAEKIILAETKKVIALGNSIFDNAQIKFQDIEIRFTLRGTTAGRASYDRITGAMTLWFHPDLAIRDIEEYKSTIRHEISHLYQRKMYPRSKPHGYQFKMIARKLGDDGGRCHSMNTKGLRQERALKRFIYTCPKCGTEFKLTQGKHKKHQQSKKYGRRGLLCGQCYKPLEFTFKMREYSNITGKVMQTYNVNGLV